MYYEWRVGFGYLNIYYQFWINCFCGGDGKDHTICLLPWHCSYNDTTTCGIILTPEQWKQQQLAVGLRCWLHPSLCPLPISGCFSQMLSPFAFVSPIVLGRTGSKSLLFPSSNAFLSSSVYARLRTAPFLHLAAV